MKSQTELYLSLIEAMPILPPTTPSSDDHSKVISHFKAPVLDKLFSRYPGYILRFRFDPKTYVTQRLFDTLLAGGVIDPQGHASHSLAAADASARS